MPAHRRSASNRIATGGAAIAALVGTALVGGVDRADAEPASPISLWAPDDVTMYQYRGRVWGDELGLRLIAHDNAFEVRTTRASYDDPVQVVWKSPGGDVALPQLPGTTIGNLADFLSFEFVRQGEDTVRRVKRKACVGGWSERVDPAAPPYSDYPGGCPYGLYATGGVQGVQAGWAGRLSGIGNLRLAEGEYAVTARISKAYADALGIAEADRSTDLTLHVVPPDYYPEPEPPHIIDRSVAPSAHAPTTNRAGIVTSYVPDLRSLPAWGIHLGKSQRYLRFSATVWNAGNSPLVVDGFRRAGEEEMDAYQYFFDGDGNQTGYQLVGDMHWDAKPSHQHWHFRDFAKYVLLDANKNLIVRSKKEAFCLANTDAVDLTNPEADWRPENTHLETACGDLSSLSIREVLAPGWGDTYSQARAGQSFDIKGLPNGTYYIAVVANPKHRLTEATTGNNTSYRKIVLSGRPGHRKVTAEQVGLVQEPVVKPY